MTPKTMKGDGTRANGAQRSALCPVFSTDLPALLPSARIYTGLDGTLSGGATINVVTASDLTIFGIAPDPFC